MKSFGTVGIAALVALFAGGARAAQSVPAPLSNESLSYPQDRPLPLPKVSEAEREHNKQVVLDFYHKVGDTRAWTTENLEKYFDPDFIQHDAAEPSTAPAYAQFMAAITGVGSAAPAAGGASPPKGPGFKMPGKTPSDANGSPVQWLIADGDLVVAARRRNWDWPGGPEAVYEGVFVDIWRLKDGKITEQWCSCTPDDAHLKLIAEAKTKGFWKK